MHIQMENAKMGEWNPEIAISVSELLEAGTCIPKCKAPDPEILGRFLADSLDLLAP